MSQEKPAERTSLSSGPWIVSQGWCDVLLAHWPVARASLRGLVPGALELDTYAGSAWISLVAMRMTDLHLRGVPPIPTTSEFPELNLRTYVRHQGRSGVYFFSIDAPGRLADYVADHLFHLPYLRAEMSIEKAGDTIELRSRRLDDTGAAFTVRYTGRGDAQVAAPGSLAQFLTERYSNFSVKPDGTVLRGDVMHPPWHLRAAEVQITRNTVIQAIGLDLPSAPWVAHYSETTAMGHLPVVEPRAAQVAPIPLAPVLDPDAARAIAAEAAQRVQRVADDPEARYQLRAAFYQNPALDIAPFGASELAFLRWELRRGVLAVPTSTPAGSAWWRAVNLRLLVASEEALLRHERNVAGPAPAEVQRWIDFLRAPSPARWYRAHNASIVRGYLDNTALARRESGLEQRLITTVLTRVLVAQALVDPPPRPGGHFEEAIARRLADPRTPAVDVIVHLADFYPSCYPLVEADAAAVFDRLRTPEGILEHLFDHDLVGPRQVAVYRYAAELLAIPELLALVASGVPRYPS